MSRQNATTSLDEQKQKAGQAKFALSPGEPIPDEDLNASTTTSSSSSTSATSTASSAPAVTSSAAPVQKSGSSFPPGAIAGVVVGAVAIIALAAALFYFVGRHRSMKAREAAQGLFGAEKSPYSTNSPSSPTPGEPMIGPGGMVYVPVKAMDYNRMSMPQISPTTNPHYSTVSHDMGAHGRYVHSVCAIYSVS
jgi:hypothetical protein